MSESKYLFNLLFFSKDACRSSRLEKLIQPLMSTYSCNLIKIYAQEHPLEMIPFLVYPKLKADLPIYLILPEDITLNTPELKPLISLASRIIFVAHETPTIPLFAKRLIPLIKKNSSQDYMDLDFAFISNWRNILPKVFDTEEKIHELKNCNKISLTYHGKATKGRALGLYLTCWLAAQLNWKPQAFKELKNKTMLSFLNGEKNLCCELTAEESLDVISGTLLYLKIEGNNNCTWEFTLDSTNAQVNLHYTEDTFCSLPEIFPVKNFKRGLTLAKNILFNPCSDHYYNMLNTLKEFAHDE